MSVYPHVEQIKDPATRQAVKILFDKLAAVEAQANDTPTFVAPQATVTGTGDARVTNLADPTQNQDAVNKRTLRTLVQTLVNDALKKVGISQGITARI